MITTEQLAAHKKWIEDHPNGQRLILPGADLRDTDLHGADLRGAVLRNADLRGADLSDADLRGVFLRDTDLSSANLRGAILSDANLSNADLRGADLSGVILRDTNLSYADLRGAVGLSIAADAPERLKAVASAALQCDALNMDAWHTCDTQHCIAGWAVHLAGEPGRIMESMMGTEIAGLYLLGIEAHAHFFKNAKEAKEFLQNVLASTSK